MAMEIVLATGNKGKVKEIQQVLSNAEIVVRPQSDFDVPEAEETGLSFIENAIIKARNACKHTGLPAIADDSGIEVDFLNGQPGIYSSRYAGVEAESADNNAKLLQALKGVEATQRSARFQCVIVYLKHEFDPTPQIFQGTWEGAIAESKSGKQGFGYDPLFIVSDHDCTAAELEPDTKNRISHRGQALLKLMNSLEINQTS